MDIIAHNGPGRIIWDNKLTEYPDASLLTNDKSTIWRKLVIYSTVSYNNSAVT